MLAKTLEEVAKRVTKYVQSSILIKLLLFIQHAKMYPNVIPYMSTTKSPKETFNINNETDVKK